ncbi:sulfotransferase [Patiriisocius marinus]|uniref:sulfotransferase n=1 Tax=Patiriisocius marinus TaxID=1397112 RepID=UPI00232C243A|nr:sulfotransferase [Patiriisocius marinus]
MIFRKTKKEFDKKLIFIIGSGRSGTHLLGRTLASNELVESFIEDKKFFDPITKLATGQDKNTANYQKILKNYKKHFSRSKKNIILEKTHPNIWFVEDLINYFPEAKCIGISRNVYATVSSMLNHSGVLSWYKILDLNIENQFLGITKENKDWFKDLSIESKCAYRWISHIKRLNHLKKTYPQSVKVIDYDLFYDDQPRLIEDIKSFIGIDIDLKAEPLKKAGTEKWKTFLTKEQINNIDAIVSQATF